MEPFVGSLALIVNEVVTNLFIYLTSTVFTYVVSTHEWNLPRNQVIGYVVYCFFYKRQFGDSVDGFQDCQRKLEFTYGEVQREHLVLEVIDFHTQSLAQISTDSVSVTR